MEDFFNKKKCDRCGAELHSRMMSKMNEDVLCLDCIKEEKTHPKYKEAVAAELTEVQKRNYNYKGLFANQRYPFGFDKMVCSVK